MAVHYQPLPLQPLPLAEAEFSPASIIAARPLGEFYAHLKNGELPAFELVIRCIKVIALAIFTWHLYDHLMLLRSEAIIHSLDGRVVVIPSSGRDRFGPHPLPHLYFTAEDLADFNHLHPHLLEQADYFQVSPATSENILSTDSQPPAHKSSYYSLSETTVVDVPDFSDYNSINAETIRNYFRAYHHFNLTNGASIYDLLNSSGVRKFDSPRDLHS